MKEGIHKIPAVRQKQILELLDTQGVVQIETLTDLYGISKATARRDLDQLSKAGALIRTHGGGISSTKTAFDRPHRDKQLLMIEEKQRIAQRAAAVVQEGSSIFLDSGTTCLAIARQLTEKRDLTVVSNNTEIIHEVEFHPTATVISTGGIKRQHYNVLTGSITESFVRTLNVDFAFVGADAVDVRGGVYGSAMVEIGLKRAITQCGQRVFLVADSSKFRRTGLVRECGFEHFDTVITDSGIRDQEREALERIPGLLLEVV